MAASRALAPSTFAGSTRTAVEAKAPWVDAVLEAARRDLNRRTATGLDAAARRYSEIERQWPQDPRAQAGLARVAALRADLRLGDRFALYFESRSRAERALAREPTQVDALLALSSAQRLLEWDAAAAGRSLEAALAVAAHDPDVHQVRAWWLSAAGRHREAIDAATRASALAPGSATKRSDLAFVLTMAGRFDAAAAEARAVLDANPREGAAWGALLRSRLGAGDLDGALDLHLDMLRTYGVPPEAVARWRAVGEAEGYWAFSSRWLESVPSERLLIARAAALAHLGQLDRAFGLVERAVERRDWEALWLESLPELAPLHRDGRFQQLLNRLEA
ncbi:MAG: tetratricopeptide repeat protein [Acidobacteriota bacterium]